VLERLADVSALVEVPVRDGEQVTELVQLHKRIRWDL